MGKGNLEVIQLKWTHVFNFWIWIRPIINCIRRSICQLQSFSIWIWTRNSNSWSWRTSWI